MGLFQGRKKAWALSALAGLQVALLPFMSAPAVAATTQVTNIIAIGDSYTAGNNAKNEAKERVGGKAGKTVPYYGARGCNRNPQNYAGQLHDALAADTKRGKDVGFYVNAACSGTWTYDIDGSHAPDDRPGRNQLADLPADVKAEANLVLTSMGGNDAGFEALVRHCFVQYVSSFEACVGSLNTAYQELPGILSRTRERLNLIAAQIPHARVVLVGYPYLHAREEDKTLCSAGRCIVPSVEVEKLQERATADQAGLVNSLGSRFVYANLLAGWGGNHGVGAKNGQWIGDVNPTDVDQSYHPTAVGYNATMKYLRQLGVENGLQSVPVPSQLHSWVEASNKKVVTAGTASYVVSYTAASADRSAEWALTPIPTPATYRCQVSKLGQAAEILQSDTGVASIRRSPIPNCVNPNEVKNKIVESDDTDHSWLIDNSGNRKAIPSTAVFSCLAASYPRTGGYVDADINSLKDGGTAACVAGSFNAKNKVARLQGTGTTFYVDNSNVKHAITTGGVYNCYTAWKKLAEVELSEGQLNSLRAGPDATCTVPEANDKILKLSGSNKTWYIENGSRRSIQTGGVYNCLTAWKSKTVQEVSQAQIDTFADGATMTCSVPEANNKILKLSGTTKTWYIENGSRRSIPTGGVYNCLTAWKNTAVQEVSQAQIDTFADGSTMTCSVPEVNGKILKLTGTSNTWYIDNGSRRSIGSGGVYNCLTAWKGVTVQEVSQVKLDAFADGPAMTCSVPEATNNVLKQNSNNWFVDAQGTKHPIRTGGVYLCFTKWKNAKVLDNLTQAQIDTFANGSDATCSVPEANDAIIRVAATGSSWYIENGSKRSIPTGGVFNCLYAWKGKRLIDNLEQGHADTFANGDTMTCSVPEANDTIVRVEATGASWFIENGKRRPIPTGGVFNCLHYWKGKSAYLHGTQAMADTFADGSTMTCDVPEANGTIVRVGATGASWYIENGTRRAIPTGGVFNCLYAWKGVPLYDNMQQGHADTFADGPTMTCSVPEANDRIVRVEATGASWFIENGNRRAIPTGGVFNCLFYWKNKVAYLHATQAMADTFANGSTMTCSVPEAERTIVRVGATGASWYIENGRRRAIPDGGVFNCLYYNRHVPLWENMQQGHADTFADGATMTC